MVTPEKEVLIIFYDLQETKNRFYKTSESKKKEIKMASTFAVILCISALIFTFLFSHSLYLKVLRGEQEKWFGMR